MLRRKHTPKSRWLSLLWLVAAPTVLTAALTLKESQVLWAQTPDPLEGVEIPASLPQGSKLSIASSDAMRAVNEALESRFKTQYNTTEVAINYEDSNAAIQALIDGKADLAAIGRGLTETEQQQGLTEIPLTRHKIALIVSPDNPFAGSLTVEQFAQIFRGEITNWSQVGGPDAPIVLIDRPAISDTRQAFRGYPVFQSAPFEAAASAVTLTEDDTDTVIQKLGTNGLGYAVAEQVLNNPSVKIVPMHDTLPDDPRYPFSQPLGYVYQAASASPAALAYLGYATNPDNEAAIEAARSSLAQAPASTPTPEAQETMIAPTPTPEAQETMIAPTPVATGRTTGVPWWPWLLALPLLGGLLWWLLKGQAPVVAPLAGEKERRIILTPRNCRDAYAYWELPQAEVDALKRQNYALALRLHDVTDIDNIDQTTPHSMRQFDCEMVATGDQHLPIAIDDRDYLVELGYVGNEQDWHALARSERVRVPACPSAVPQRGLGIGAAAAAAAGVTGLVATQVKSQPPLAKSTTSDRMILVPRSQDSAYAYWELTEAQQEGLRREGRHLSLRITDAATQGDTYLQQYDCPDYIQDMHVAIPTDSQDYQAELGYTQADGRWYSVVKSDPVHVPAGGPTTSGLPASGLSGDVNGMANPSTVIETAQAKVSGLAGNLGKAASGLIGDTSRVATAAVTGGTAAVAGAGAAAWSLIDRDTAQPLSGAGVRSEMGVESRIILVPVNPHQAYAYWEVADVHQTALKQQGGQQMKLRIHDATNLDIDYEAPHSTQEYDCLDTDQDRHVPIGVPDRDYVAELGYLTDDGGWLRLLRSLHVRVPAED